MRSIEKTFICAVLVIFTCFFYCGITYSQDSSTSQTLISRLPDDVLVFASTSGGDALKPEFEKTILGRVWNDPSVKTFIQSTEQNLLQKVQQESGSADAATIFTMVKNIAGLVASRPIIIGSAQKNTQDGPPVYGFAFMYAGPRKEQIAAILSSLEAKVGEGEIVDVNVGSYKFHGPKDARDVPAYWGWIGNYLVFALNDGEGQAIKYIQTGAPSRTQSYIERTSGGNDLFAIYINVEKGLNTIKAIAAMEGGQADFAKVETFMAQVGVAKIKTITSRTGFEGTGIVVDELVEIPQPRTGLFANLRPINLDMIDMASANAVSVSVVNIDIAGIYDTLFTAIKSVAGSDFDEVEQGIAELEKQTGVKIRQGLLESLNGQMAVYALPGGVSLQSIQGGFVVIAGLNNAQLFQDSIAAIGKFASENANGMVQVSSQVQNGRTLNTFAIVPLAVAQMMPTWTIVGDNVVIGSNPAICSAAVEQITSNAPSIRSTESFRNATANMPSGLISFQYTDSKVQLTQTMAAMQQVWPMLAMMTAQQGVTLPVVLPNLTDIIKDVSPSVQYSWFDQKGLRSKYKGSGIEPGIGAVAGAAVGLGVLMPALTRVRQTAFRMVTATNMSAIGKAMLIYANDYDDKFPPNLQVLAKLYDLDARVFESKRKPAGFTGPTYIYIAGQTTSDPPGDILVYENPAYLTDGINVLFLDSHVQVMSKASFLEALKATYQRLNRPMPEVKFKN